MKRRNRNFVDSLRARVVLFIAVSAVCGMAVADVNDADVNNSTVLVKAYRGRDVSHSGTGYVVETTSDKGFVVTSASTVANADSVTVQTPARGAELVARLVVKDPSIDLALLSVTGLALRPLTFSAAIPQSGDVVWTAVKWGDSAGSVGLIRGSIKKAWSPGGGDVAWLSHDAAAGNSTAGSVLLNNCGQIAGFNLAGPDANGNVKALDAASLASVLAARQVSVKQATQVCVSDVVQARRQAAQAASEAKRASEEAAQAQKAARLLERKLQDSNKQNLALVVETRAARQRADEAIRKADIAHKNAETTRVELEKKTASIIAQTQAMMKYMEDDNARAEARFQAALRQQRDESATRDEWLIGIALAVVLGLLAFIFMLRNRDTASARQEVAPRPNKPVRASGTEIHRQELTEYVLDGRDEDGIRYLLRISGDQLSTADGVVIGRNPQDSPYIINHADVSRKHARMKVMKNRVFIEDLGSTNGTSVNGQSIDDKGPVSVVNGDQIIIGSVVMKLRVLGA